MTTLLSSYWAAFLTNSFGKYMVWPCGDTYKADDWNCENTKTYMQIWSLQLWQLIWNCFNSVAITTAMIMHSIKLSDNIARIIALIFSDLKHAVVTFECWKDPTFCGLPFSLVFQSRSYTIIVWNPRNTLHQKKSWNIVRSRAKR